jgi:hypothetical protein
LDRCPGNTCGSATDTDESKYAAEGAICTQPNGQWKCNNHLWVNTYEGKYNMEPNNSTCDSGLKVSDGKCQFAKEKDGLQNIGQPCNVNEDCYGGWCETSKGKAPSWASGAWTQWPATFGAVCAKQPSNMGYYGSPCNIRTIMMPGVHCVNGEGQFSNKHGQQQVTQACNNDHDCASLNCLITTNSGDKADAGSQPQPACCGPLPSGENVQMKCPKGPPPAS